ncbi:hypothetical protein ISN45_Aa01g000120 [Arabidopsis thaliana x Arabidopsis arenosa]|uniref:Transmembrane protein n=1 Tax=Arabidopsis thaliana x Arabidopsis arenosa TaxID=1240361 RepID=A0A8T2BTY9_9BRAS|nr:hypothetical protein ISN45_Aa01g000120 [Arabidopsis thaliana x Arabidopsis arenosa]
MWLRIGFSIGLDFIAIEVPRMFWINQAFYNLVLVSFVCPNLSLISFGRGKLNTQFLQRIFNALIEALGFAESENMPTVRRSPMSENMPAVVGVLDFSSRHTYVTSSLGDTCLCAVWPSYLFLDGLLYWAQLGFCGWAFLFNKALVLIRKR